MAQASLVTELKAVAKAAIAAALFTTAALTCLLLAVFGVVSACQYMADFMWAVIP